MPQKSVTAKLAEYGVTMRQLVREIDRTSEPYQEQGSQWYPSVHRWADNLAFQTGLTVAQVAAVTAAVSPQTAWARNQRMAEVIAFKARDLGHLSSIDAARQLALGLHSNVAMAIDIVRGIDALTGRKRQSFASNIADPAGSTAVTVDLWMCHAIARASNGRVNARSLIGPVGKGKALYSAIERACRIVAARRNVPACSVQAAYWIAVRGAAE